MLMLNYKNTNVRIYLVEKTNQVQINIYNPYKEGHSFAFIVDCKDKNPFTLTEVFDWLVESGQLDEQFNKAQIAFVATDAYEQM
jgi:hypothetical protein